MYSYYSLLHCGHSAGPEAQFLCSVWPLSCAKDCPVWLSQDRPQLWQHQSPELTWIPCDKSLKPRKGLEDCREFCKSPPSPPPPPPSHSPQDAKNHFSNCHLQKWKGCLSGPPSELCRDSGQTWTCLWHRSEDQLCCLSSLIVLQLLPQQ